MTAAPPAAMAHTFHHSERGETTLGAYVEMIIWHTRHHLEQVEAARAGQLWTPPAKEHKA